jgi:hypothetical protein
MDTQNSSPTIVNLTSKTDNLNTENALTLLRIGTAYRPEQDATLFGKIASEVLARYTLDQVRARPVSMLLEVLACPAARALGRNIAHEFDKVAPFKEDADTFNPTEMTILRKAVINDLEPPGFALPGYLASYRLASPHNTGRSYNEIITDIEQYMLSSGRAASPKEAMLAVHLLASHAHPELLIKDIPPDLPYGVSLTWVNFKHGVDLAEAREPGSSFTRSFQTLVELPASRNAGLTTDAEREAFEASRLEPVLIWAELNGLLRPLDATPYSETEIQSATDAFNRHEQQCLTSLTALTIEPPNRRVMATHEIDHAKPSPAVIALLEREMRPEGWPIRPMRLYPDTRLVPRSYGDVYFNGDLGGTIGENYAGPVSVSNQLFNPHDTQRPTHCLVDVYMDGENIDEWRKPGLRIEEGASKMLAPETALFKELPPINELFEQRFAQYLSQAKSAYGFLITRLLACLPLEHRIAIEYGEVQIYSLRTQTTGQEAGEEIEKDKEPLRGRQGFILQARYDNRVNYYEVFPSLSLARHRPDIDQLLIGGVERIEKWRVSNATRPPVSVTVIRGTSLPFDWEAYLIPNTAPKDDVHSTLIVEPIGTVLSAKAAVPLDSDVAPPTMRSSRTLEIAQRVSTDLFYVNEQALHKVCAGRTSLEETEDPIITILKVLTPWGSLEDLLSGERDKIRHGAFGLFGFMLPFRSPLGKFASGSIRWAKQALHTFIFKLSLPRFRFISKLSRINGKIGIGMSGRGVAAGRWSLDKTGAKFNKNLTDAAQGKWDEFQNAIYHHGLPPQNAAAAIGGANLKRLAPVMVEGKSLGQFQIRLSLAERATFTADYSAKVVKVIQVGGHTR